MQGFHAKRIGRKAAPYALIRYRGRQDRRPHASPSFRCRTTAKTTAVEVAIGGRIRPTVINGSLYFIFIGERKK